MGIMETPDLQNEEEVFQYLEEVRDSTERTIALMQDIMFPVIIAVGAVANIFVIAVIVLWERNRTNRSVTQLFAVNLAIADFLFVCTLPLYQATASRNWIYGEFLCRVKRGMDHLNYHSSILFLTVMSLDRLLATVYLIRMRIYRTRRNATYACIVVWLIALATAAPYYMYATVRDPLYIGENPTCRLQFPEDITLHRFTEADLHNLMGNGTDNNGTIDEMSMFGEVFEDYLLTGIAATSSKTSLEVPTSNNATAFGGNDLGTTSMEMPTSNNATVFGDNDLNSEESLLKGITGNPSSNDTMGVEKDVTSEDDKLLTISEYEKLFEKILLVHLNGTDFNATKDYDENDPITQVAVKDCENFFHKSSSVYMGYMWFKFFGFYVIPVSLIVGSYVTILFTATRRLKRMPENQKRMRKHMVVTILVMVSAFIVCWSPLLIWNVVTNASYIVVNRFWACHMYEAVFEIMAFANSALNPILYWLSSKSFRSKIRCVYEYLTKGRNMSSLVVMKRDDSTHTRSSRLFRDASARMALPPKEVMLLQPVGEETKEELEAELITRPKKPQFRPIQDSTSFGDESAEIVNDDKQPIAAAVSATNINVDDEDH